MKRGVDCKCMCYEHGLTARHIAACCDGVMTTTRGEIQSETNGEPLTMDEALVDIGDELVVRIAGYPVGKGEVVNIIDGHAIIQVFNPKVRSQGISFRLPLDFKEHDVTDGVAHSLTKGIT